MQELRQKRRGSEMPQMPVYFIKVARKPQQKLWPRDFSIDIQEVITPKNTIPRYNKPWRFSQPKIHDGYFVGKLGFKSTGTKPSIDYDDKQMDYVERVEESNDSNVAFGVLDLSKQILAFETKPPDINYQAFKGAFGKFLSDRADVGLTIEDFVQTSKFVAWVKDEVERVTSFKANMRVPNPNWSKVPKAAQTILRETNADTAMLELNKTDDTDDGLNTTTTINEIVQYGEAGYSSIVARGKKGEQLKIFDSRKQIPSRRVDIPKSLEDDEKWNTIIDAMRKFINETFK